MAAVAATAAAAAAATGFRKPDNFLQDRFHE
jgi:hypothetical protein